MMMSSTCMTSPQKNPQNYANDGFLLLTRMFVPLRTSLNVLQELVERVG